jgi:hypothetical protein
MSGGVQTGIGTSGFQRGVGGTRCLPASKQPDAFWRLRFVMVFVVVGGTWRGKAE